MNLDSINAAPPAPELPLAAKPACEQCGNSFEPRKGSGGKPQRFCSTECRMNFHAQRSQRSPTCGAGNQTDEAVEHPEPTPHQRRAMLIAGVEDFDATHRPETAAECVDCCISEGKIGQPQTEDQAYPNEFDWFDDESIVLRPQLAVAIYNNERGGLVIRQERDWNEESDTFIVIAPENVAAFVDRITDAAGIPSFGGPQPKPTPVRK